MLQITNLTASIEQKTILRDITCTFEKGKIYAIMGPNGSGKSTLASCVMGNPLFTSDPTSHIVVDHIDVTDMSPDERAKKGLFLTFQSPIALSGVTIYQLLRYALDGKMDPLAIRKKVQLYAKKLKIPDELLSRSIHDGFSGGERKKVELLQAAVLDPSVIFFDEIDTGVDVDALRTIARSMNAFFTKEKTYIIITHYTRILKYVVPDEVLVLMDGRLVKKGGPDLADKIEKQGYDWINTKLKVQSSKVKI